MTTFDEKYDLGFLSKDYLVFTIDGPNDLTSYTGSDNVLNSVVL